MKMIRNAFLVLVLIVATNICTAAQGGIMSAFKSAPAGVFPMIDESARLDMIDYYNSPTNVGATNVFSGRSRITEIVPGSMRIAMTSASRYQLVELPVAADTLVAVITTILTPAPDSKIAVYGSDWTIIPTEKVFKTPEMKDWLTDIGKKNKKVVESLVPFMLVGYDFDPSTMTLTLVNNMQSYLSEEVYDKVKPYLHEKLAYRWNGKKFETVK